MSGWLVRCLAGCQADCLRFAKSYTQPVVAAQHDYAPVPIVSAKPQTSYFAGYLLSLDEQLNAIGDEADTVVEEEAEKSKKTIQWDSNMDL